MADTVKFDALLDDLLKDGQSPEDILGQHGLLKQLTQRLVERALAGELTAPLGYEPAELGEAAREHRRNGRGSKRVQTETGPLPIEVPRDREGRVELPRVKKRQRRLAGLMRWCSRSMPADCPPVRARAIWKSYREPQIPRP